MPRFKVSWSEDYETEVEAKCEETAVFLAFERAGGGNVLGEYQDFSLEVKELKGNEWRETET